MYVLYVWFMAIKMTVTHCGHLECEYDTIPAQINSWLFVLCTWPPLKLHTAGITSTTTNGLGIFIVTCNCCIICGMAMHKSAHVSMPTISCKPLQQLIVTMATYRYINADISFIAVQRPPVYIPGAQHWLHGNGKKKSSSLIPSHYHNSG